MKVKCQMSHVTCCRGFTLVELLIIIALSVVLAASAAPLYSNFQVTAQLNESTSQTIQTVRMARQRAVSRVNNAAHGVYVEVNPSAADRIIMYQGSSYASRSSGFDRITELDEGLSLSTTIDGSDVNFSRGLGLPSATGTISIVHDASGERVVFVNDTGSVEEQ